MHPTEVQSSPPPTRPAPGTSWRSEMTGYHWFVFVVAALGWLADCMDQQLFNLARVSAVTELIGKDYTEEQLQDPEAARERDTRIKSWASRSTSGSMVGTGWSGSILGVPRR